MNDEQLLADDTQDAELLASNETPEPQTDEPKATDAAANAEQADENAPAGEKAEEPPASPSDDDEPEKKSRSQVQRERRKAYVADLEAKRLQAEQAKERIMNPGEEPKADDFEDHEEYLASKAVWKYRNADSATARERAEADAKQYGEEISKERLSNYNAHVAEAKTRIADYDAVVNSAHISQPLADLILQSDAPADLAYAIASQHDSAQLSSLDPVGMARTVGRIEASLQQAPEPRRVSKAPEPIAPVAATPTTARANSEESYAEYTARRSKEMGF